MSSISGLGGFMTAINFLCRRLGLVALIAPVAILVGFSNVGAAAAYPILDGAVAVRGGDSPLPASRFRPHSPAMENSLCRHRLQWCCRDCVRAVEPGRHQRKEALMTCWSDMSLIAYFIPYLFVFASMIRLQSHPAAPGALRLPAGKRVAIPLACVGFFSTAAAIVLSSNT